MKLWKRIQSIHPYERWMFACVAIATLLRLVLIYFNWPFTNSDEGNMGLLALHVAYQGDHPIFFYGGNYLGPLEGYAAAPIFRLFGPSVFALRLPLVLFFAVFLLSVYYLVRLLYKSEKFALASVILLGLGSPDVLFLQLRASGEYPEIEMFAVLMCLLAIWLALSSSSFTREINARLLRWKRIAIYGFLGLIVGLALWVDLLILPFVATVGLLLCFFCRRELFRWSGLSLLLGIIVGAFPLIYYNLTAPWNQNSWFVLSRIREQGTAEMLAHHLTWVNQLSGTMIIALPMATGGSLRCPLSTIPPSGSPTLSTLPCVLFQSIWGFGYLVLWFIAAGIAVSAIMRYRRQLRTGTLPGSYLQERQGVIRQCSRLMILVSVGLTLLLYAISPSSATAPNTTFRYLTCLLIAIPILLWPIWRGISSEKLTSNLMLLANRAYVPVGTRVEQQGRGRLASPLLLGNLPTTSNLRAQTGLLLRAGLLLLVIATFASATITTFMQIPTARAVYSNQQTLIQDLLHIDATRVYSDYWTCNILTFLSHEKIICSALDEHLNPGYDRYLPYRFIVQANPRPTYIFPSATQQAQAMKQRVLQASSYYRQYIFEGYIIYQVI